MNTRKIKLRRCFYDEGNKMMIVNELVKLKSRKKYWSTEIPEIGKGIAIPGRIRKYRFKE